MTKSLGVKSSFGAEVKGDTRSYLRGFIRRNLDKEPEYLKVVCLPGAEARDVLEIYDPLGVPRENITGIEANPRVVDKLQRQKLGIHLYKGRDTDFFQSTNEKYDVISLDYFQEFNDSVLDSLTAIFSRQLLTPISILHTNFYGRREHPNVKANYSMERLHFYETNQNMLDRIKKDLGHYEEALHKDQSLSPQEKSIILQNNLTMIEGFQRLIDERRKRDTSVGELRSIIPFIIANLATLGKECTTNTIDFAKYRDDLFIKQCNLFLNSVPLADTDSFLEKEMLMHEIYTKIKPGAVFEKLKDVYPYALRRHQSYKYISDDGSPMLTDVFLFDQKRELFDNKWLDVKGLIDVINERGFTPRVNACFGHWVKVLNEFDFEQRIQTNRIDLGSSFKPSLKREEAYKLLEQGLSDEEIMKRFRVRPMRLAAFKAWRTMNNKKKETTVEEAKAP